MAILAKAETLSTKMWKDPRLRQYKFKPIAPFIRGGFVRISNYDWKINLSPDPSKDRESNVYKSLAKVPIWHA